MSNGVDQINKYLISKGITPTQGDKFPLFDVRKDLYNKLGLTDQLGSFIGSGTQNYSMLNQLQKVEKDTGVNINPNNLNNMTSIGQQTLAKSGISAPLGSAEATQQLLARGQALLGQTPPSQLPQQQPQIQPTVAPTATPEVTATNIAGGLAGTSAEGLLPEIPTGGDLASQALEQVQNSATFSLQMEAQEAQKSAVQLGAQRQTQDFIKNIASRGLFFSGAKSEGVSNIEVDKLANLLNIDRSFAMLMAQGLETAAQDIAKEAAKGRTEAIDALATLGYAINPLTGKVEATLQAQQQQATQQYQQKQLQLQQQQANKPITEEIDGNLYQYDRNTGQWNMTVQGQQAFEPPKTLTTDQGIMQWNEQSGGWEKTGFTSGDGVGGTGTPVPDNLTPDQLSPLAKAIFDGTIGLKDITPTQRAQIAPELNSVGYSNLVSSDNKQNVSYIKNEMVNVLDAWRGVPDNLKGVLQGRLGTIAKSGEWNEEVSKFNAAKGIIGMALTRLFEKGRISDQDRTFYMSLMPNVNINEEAAEAGAKELIRLLEQKLVIQVDTLGGGGVTGSQGDTSGNDPLGLR